MKSLFPPLLCFVRSVVEEWLVYLARGSSEMRCKHVYAQSVLIIDTTCIRRRRRREREREERTNKQAHTQTHVHTRACSRRLSTSFHKQFHEHGALCSAENLITVETGETARKNFICLELRQRARSSTARRKAWRQSTARQDDDGCRVDGWGKMGTEWWRGQSWWGRGDGRRRCTYITTVSRRRVLRRCFRVY